MSFKQLVLGASGIYIAYLSASILSEKLYSTKYPLAINPKKSHDFNYPSLIVWVSCLFCAIFGYFKGKVTKEPPNPISLKQQLILAFLFTANMLAANYSLLYISFLNKVIGGNMRYMMVVVIGVFFSRVKKSSSLKLSPKKILVAILITVGVIMFTLASFGKKKVKSHIDPEQQWKGYLFMTISIFADAFFTDSQAYAKVNFKPTANHLFTSANFFGFLFVLLFSIIKGEADNQLRFCMRHPTVLIDIIALASLQVLGQVAIYYVVANFKQHMFPLISTTRKVLTVLLMNAIQWLAIFLVFGGLSYEVLDQMKSKRQKQIENIPNNEIQKDKNQ